MQSSHLREIAGESRSLRIKSVETFLVPADERPGAWCRRKAFLFVRVEAASGLVGWGEAHTLKYREAATAKLIEALGEQLTGREATDIQALKHRTFNAFGEQRAGIDVFAAASGIEIALWDLLGRELGVPVYKLIGGTCHEAIPVYANIWTHRRVSPDVLARKAAESVSAGYSTLKFYPFFAGESLEEGIAKAQAVREAVGPWIGLAADLWRNWSPAEARAVCKRLEPFDLAWVEDPIAPISAVVYRRLSDQAAQPLMTGETLAGKAAFRDYFRHQAVALVNPDVCACGGILELREIAAMAEPWQTAVSPHNFNSMGLGLATTLQAAAGMANLHLCEFFPDLADEPEGLFEDVPRPESGKIPLPRAPGVGASINEARLRSAALKA